MTTVATTTVFCRHCQASHPAHLQREDDRIFGVAECPRHTAPVELSDDADLFLLLREQDRSANDRARSSGASFSRGQLYITDACNCHCPVCYASSGPRTAAAHLPVPEVLRRAAAARGHGLRRLLLIGGEPTVHPDLVEIVASVRKLGVAVTMVTNGRAIGEDPALARRLKHAGLAHLNLQFDTLDRGILRQLRGHDNLETKQRAIAHAVAAKLPFSLTVTVARPNLPEVGEIIRWAETLPVLPTLVLFQSMVLYGRYPEGLATVTREAMINGVIASGAVAGATRANLHAVPRVPPHGSAVHPDCGTLLYALRRRDGLVPADVAMDIAGFGRAVVEDRGTLRTWANWLLQFARHLRPGYRRELLGALLDLRPGRPNRRLMMIGFTSFCAPEFLDEQRLARCGNHVLLASGPEPVCGHFGRQPAVNLPAPRTSP